MLFRYNRKLKLFLMSTCCHINQIVKIFNWTTTQYDKTSMQLTVIQQLYYTINAFSCMSDIEMTDTKFNKSNRPTCKIKHTSVWIVIPFCAPFLSISLQNILQNVIKRCINLLINWLID